MNGLMDLFKKFAMGQSVLGNAATGNGPMPGPMPPGGMSPGPAPAPQLGQMPMVGGANAVPPDSFGTGLANTHKYLQGQTQAVGALKQLWNKITSK